MNGKGSLSERRLLIAFSVVAGSFVISTVYSQFRVRIIDEEALSIADRVSPNIEHLAAARAELRRLPELAQLYSKAHGEDRPVDPMLLGSLRARLREDLDRYNERSDDPKAAEISREISGDAKRLDQLLDLWERGLWKRDFAAAELLAQTEVLPAADQTNAAILRAMEINAGEARRLALNIAAVRNNGVRVLLVLMACSTAVSVLVTMFAVGAMRDYRELQESHSELLRQRADELEQFAGRVAHDILNPLGTVGMAMELVLRERELPQSARGRLLRGQSNLQRVKRFVDGLLGFARAGAKPERDASTDVRGALDELRAELEPYAKEAGVALLVQDVPCHAVACNPGILMSLLENLVRNAIKYIGNPSEKRVELRVMEETTAVRFEVQDSGPGLAPELQARVFEPYFRAPGSPQAGIGLGLATVKRLVEAHGGSVGVRSEQGRGCLFWFCLPKSLDQTKLELGGPNRTKCESAPKDTKRHELTTRGAAAV